VRSADLLKYNGFGGMWSGFLMDLPIFDEKVYAFTTQF
jgi:hypothetical protein